MSKVLLFSPVRLDPETLALALRAHRALRVPEGVTIERVYFDDNTDLESTRVLNADTDSIKTFDASLTPGAPCADYREGDTHQWNVSNISRVAAIKNKAIEAFLKSDYTHLFFVDSDVILHPETVTHLLSLNADVVAEVFWTKWVNEQDVWAPQVWDVHPYAHNGVDSIIRLRDPGAFTPEVGGLGACTLISRTALEKIGPDAFTPIPSLNFEGEDRHFCIRASAVGFKLYADTYYPPFHVYRKSQLQEAINWYEAQAPPDYFRTLWLDDQWEAEMRKRCEPSIPVTTPTSKFSGGTKCLSICVPGQNFSAAWMVNFIDLYTWVCRNMKCHIQNCYTSNASVTRQSLTRQVLSTLNPATSGGAAAPDYVLWIDDDNLLTAEHLQLLLGDLDAHPELDIVVGWCVVSSDTYDTAVYKTSCGDFAENGLCACMPLDQLHGAHSLIGIQWSGFPAVLMRADVLKKLGQQAFRYIPIPYEVENDTVTGDDNGSVSVTPGTVYAYGFFGEDTSFFKRAHEAGFKSAVDPRVKVPHLKLRDSNPKSTLPRLAPAVPTDAVNQVGDLVALEQ